MRLSKHEAVAARAVFALGATLTEPVARALGLPQAAPTPADVAEAHALTDRDPEADPDLETEERALMRRRSTCG